MSLNPIFQLSALSQNDQPNPSCPGCSVGDQITATLLSYGGGQIFLSDPPQPYPATQFPINTPVLLPIPNSGKPTPTWFMEVENGIENAWFLLEVTTPGISTKRILIEGINMPAWTKEGPKTNQIYQGGDCGIFGFAQKNTPANQPVYWIYTVTGGVCNPQVHPPA